MTTEDTLAELLLRWEELHEQGRDVSAEELCRDCPQLAAALADRIRSLQVTAWMDGPDDGGGTPPDPPAPNAPSTLAGRYRLDERIAEGGFAEVWKGFDLELRRAVAVKMPKPGRLHSTERFLAEARRVAGLKHPGVVPVFDVGRDGDAAFIVSELIEGGSLTDRIVTNRPTVQESARLVAEVADTLAYAHRHGFLHRDIKPANILIDHHGRALVADFGIARSPDDGAEPSSFGTLAYMAPEQVEGKSADHRADIYSLGVVLYELLVGRLLHRADNPVALRREIVSGPPPLIPATANVPERLAAVCVKSLARDPAARYQDAAALANDLRAALGMRPPKRRWLLIAVSILLTVSAIGSWGAALIRHRAAPVPVAVKGEEPEAAVPPRWKHVGTIGGDKMLKLPIGLAWTMGGDLLVANSGNGTVSQLDRRGRLLRTFGEPGRGERQLRYPYSVCISGTGLVLISDQGMNRVQVFDPNGQWLRNIGEGGNQPGQFQRPRGISVTSDQELVVVDGDNHRVQLFTLAGRWISAHGEPGSATGQLRSPSGLHLVPGGLVLCDVGNRRLQEFDFKGQVRRTYFANEIEPQACVRLNDQGWIVADTFHKRVAFFNEKGGREIDLPIPPGVELHPLGLALASDGLLAVSNYSTAEIYLFRRLDSNTDLNSEVHSALSLGRLHWDRKQWHEAEAAFTEAIRFDPNNAEAYHRRAGCRVNTKRVADSLPDFDAAVRLDPKNPEVVKNRGIALLNMLRFDDAVRDLKSAIDLGPTDPQPYRKVLGQVYAQRAVETGKGKKWPEAITDMDEAIKLDPTNADYFDKRGSLRFNLRHFKEAAADFTEAVRLAPTTPDYHLHLEWANARKPK